MTRGTSHFVNRSAAFKYYRTYGLSRVDVSAKFAADEIHIGPPTVKPGERVRVNDEGRYEIVSLNAVQP